MAIGFRATAFHNNGGGSVTIAVPTGTVNDDVMYASIWRTGTTGTTPSGWTLIQTGLMNSSNYCLKIYRRVAASEPANYTFGGGTSSYTFGFIDSFSGVDTTTPEDVTTPASVDNVTGTVTWPSITTATDGAWHLAFVADMTTIASISGPSGYTVRGHDTENTKASQDATNLIATHGVVSGITATFSGSASRTAISIAIRPASSGPVSVLMVAALSALSSVAAVLMVVRGLSATFGADSSIVASLTTSKSVVLSATLSAASSVVAALSVVQVIAGGIPKSGTSFSGVPRAAASGRETPSSGTSY